MPMHKRLLVLVAAILASGIVFLDGSVVTLALPKIAHDLHASFSGMPWVADSYLVSLSALILIGGSLGDIIGHKKIFIAGAAGFGMCSVLCGFAPSLSLLIAARMLQGAAGATLIPQSLALIDTHFPVAARSKAIGAWAAWSGAATAIAPLVGGYLLDSDGWRWIFFINIPLSIACVWLGMIGIHEAEHRLTRHLDIGGATLAVLTLGGITFGLIEGPAHAWPLRAVVALSIGAVSGMAFLYQELHHRDPMVRLALFKSRNFSGANLMTLAMYGALGGVMFSVIVYLQTVLRYSSIRAGLTLLPVTVMMLLFSRRIGVLAANFGARPLLTLGPLCAAIGILSWLRLTHDHSYATGVLPGVLLFGMGLVLIVTPLTATVLGSVAESDAGIASGINNAISRLGGLIVVALLGLFGAAESFQFGMVMCAGLAVTAAVVSLVTIRNPPGNKQT